MDMRIILLITIFTVTFTLDEISIQNKPVFIFHGILGIQTEAKINKTSSPYFYCPKVSDWYQSWFSVLENIIRVDCFVDNFKMRYDEKTDSMINQEGVEIRTLGPWGNVEGVAYLDPSFKYFSSYFAKMIDVLSQKFGYINMKDMHALGYDYRDLGDIRKMEKYFDSVTKFIENIYNSSNQSVILVSHSMGGLIISHFLQKKSSEWKNQYIDSWYSVNGAFGGSIESILGTLIGEADKNPEFISSPIKFRSLMITYPSIYFLFPSSKVYGHNKVLVIYNNTEYTVKDMRTFIPSIMNPEMSKIMKYIPESFVESPPNVYMECVYSKGIETASQITFKTKSLTDDYKVSFGDGDGLVNIESLSACQNWKNKNLKVMEITEFPNTGHFNLLNEDIFLKHFEKFMASRLMLIQKNQQN